MQNITNFHFCLLYQAQWSSITLYSIFIEQPDNFLHFFLALLLFISISLSMFLPLLCLFVCLFQSFFQISQFAWK
jgi:hypothetical protein